MYCVLKLLHVFKGGEFHAGSVRKHLQTGEHGGGGSETKIISSTKHPGLRDILTVLTQEFVDGFATFNCSLEEGFVNGGNPNPTTEVGENFPDDSISNVTVGQGNATYFGKSEGGSRNDAMTIAITSKEASPWSGLRKTRSPLRSESVTSPLGILTRFERGLRSPEYSL